MWQVRQAAKAGQILRFGIMAGAGFALASCVPGPVGIESGPGAARTLPPADDGTGPRGDYPVVLGEPFTIDGITYTPADRMNFDEVGYATLDDAAARGITAAHRTLPLPSYVEVTELNSGRTILVRVERRGPMTNRRMLALSTEAMTQLGAAEGVPVRVRRVNPLEIERTELRQGNAVPERMETPEGLLEVLRRKLPVVGSASLNAPASAETPRPPITTVDPDTGAPRTNIPLDDEVTASTPRAPEAATPAPQPSRNPASPSATPTSADGRYVVQAGAFSNRAAAESVAGTIGGFLEPVGRLWRVRVGPFATRGQAAEALAKVRRAGYSGAQIVTRR